MERQEQQQPRSGAANLADPQAQRKNHSSEINRLEAVKATLTDADLMVVQHSDSPIRQHKDALIQAKPLDQQIKSLEDLILRKYTKVQECDEAIIAAYEEKKNVEQELHSKSAELGQLKQKKAQETLQQLSAAPPQPALQMQLSATQAAFSQMLSALSMVQGMPADAVSVVTQAQQAMGQSPQVINTAAATPLGAGTGQAANSPPSSSYGSPPHSGWDPLQGNSPLDQSARYGPAQLPAHSAADPRKAAAPYSQPEIFNLDSQTDSALQEGLKQATVQEAVQGALNAAAATPVNMDQSFSSIDGIDLTKD